MKRIYYFLLTVIFYAAGICSAEASKLCDPTQQVTKPTDTSTLKKAPVKINIAPTQSIGKPLGKKEEKKKSGDNIFPLSWRPTLVY